MCQRTTCRDCGKATYRGCGMHVEQMLAGVAEDQRCGCEPRKRPSRSWLSLFRRQ